MSLIRQAPKRKRYNVSIEGNGQIQHVVIIANDTEGKFFTLCKFYGHIDAPTFP